MSSPKGPLGDDAAAFAPFAIGIPQFDRIAAALPNADGFGFTEEKRAIVNTCG